MPGHPLELILARNLLAALTVPGFITDAGAGIVFYNEAAGTLLGRRFEETGHLTPEQWREIGPVDEHGAPISDATAPLTTALRENRPAHGRFRIVSDQGGLVMVETSAVPLVGPDGFHGAMVVFWPAQESARA